MRNAYFEPISRRSVTSKWSNFDAEKMLVTSFSAGGLGAIFSSHDLLGRKAGQYMVMAGCNFG